MGNPSIVIRVLQSECRSRERLDPVEPLTLFTIPYPMSPLGANDLQADIDYYVFLHREGGGLGAASVFRNGWSQLEDPRWSQIWEKSKVQAVRSEFSSTHLPKLPLQTSNTRSVFGGDGTLSSINSRHSLEA